jgi:hypothetical protein
VKASATRAPARTPAEKLEKASRDFEKWSAVAATPGLSPAAAEWASQAARSAQAEMLLRQRAAAYQAELDAKKQQALGGLGGGAGNNESNWKNLPAQQGQSPVFLNRRSIRCQSIPFATNS